MEFKPTIVDKCELNKQKIDWLKQIDTTKPVNIFAYGSLMWKPSCNIIKQSKAVLNGYHRDFCLYSYMYRGNLKNLGLVLGIRKGGKCDGLLMELAKDNLNKDLSCIWDREMITGAYKTILSNVETKQGTKQCWVFIANTNHNQWAGNLTIQQQLELITKAHGKFGSNMDYLINTVKQLRNMNIIDERLEALFNKTLK